jgi:HK97 gp10 family phage protein
MAVRGYLSLKGLEKWLEALGQAGQDVGQAADRALQAGAEVALEGMQKRVPKDTHNLENHLAILGPEADGNYHSVQIGLLRGKGLDADTARYGHAQEYGSASMPAQPYIRPTMDEDKAKIRGAMRASLKKDGSL